MPELRVTESTIILLIMSLTLLHRLAHQNLSKSDNNQLKFELLPYTEEMGSAGFEPTTSGTQNPNHAKLDHDPDVECTKKSPI